MKRLTCLLVAAAAIALPAAARPKDDLGPLGDFAWTAQTVKIVLTRLDLNRPQRDKVLELIGVARNQARDIERNRRLTWYQRTDRMTDVSTELRSRIIHVLTGDQKDRLRDILDGNYNGGARYRSRGDAPLYRSPGYGSRSRRPAVPPRGPDRDNRPQQEDWPWQ